MLTLIQNAECAILFCVLLGKGTFCVLSILFEFLYGFPQFQQELFECLFGIEEQCL
jgi:hypothetical protein